MNEKQRDVLRANQVPIVNDLEPRGQVLDTLYEDGVLTENDVELVRSGRTRKERCQRLLAMLPTRGSGSYGSFQKALHASNYDHLVQKLVKAENEVTGYEQKSSELYCRECSDFLSGLERISFEYKNSPFGKILVKHCCLLLHNIEPLDIIDQLFQDHVIGADDHEKSRVGETRRERCQTLLRLLCSVGQEMAVDSLKIALNKKYKFIFETICGAERPKRDAGAGHHQTMGEVQLLTKGSHEKNTNEIQLLQKHSDDALEVHANGTGEHVLGDSCTFQKQAVDFEHDCDQTFQKLPHDEQTDPKLQHDEQTDLKLKHDEQTDLKLKHDKQTDLKLKHDEQTDPKHQHDEQTDPKLQHDEQTDLKLQHDEQTNLKHQHDEQTDLKLQHCEQTDPKFQHDEQTSLMLKHDEQTALKLKYGEQTDLTLFNPIAMNYDQDTSFDDNLEKDLSQDKSLDENSKFEKLESYGDVVKIRASENEPQFVRSEIESNPFSNSEAGFDITDGCQPVVKCGIVTLEEETSEKPVKRAKLKHQKKKTKTSGRLNNANDAVMEERIQKNSMTSKNQSEPPFKRESLDHLPDKNRKYVSAGTINKSMSTFHSELPGRRLSVAFNYLSTLINTGDFDKFENVSTQLKRKFPLNYDMMCIVGYLAASRDLFLTDFDSAKQQINTALDIVPKTSNPRYFILELFTAKTRMYITQKKLEKLQGALDDAMMIMETDPAGCTGRAAGWLYINDARNKTSQLSCLNLSKANALQTYNRLFERAKVSFQRSMTNFKRDGGKDGPFGFGYALCRLVILLLRCGDNGQTMGTMTVSAEEIQNAGQYIQHLEDSDIFIPKILEMHFRLAKCDYQFRRKNFIRALEHAEAAFHIASDLKMLEFTEHAQNRVSFLRSKASVINRVTEISDSEANEFLFGESSEVETSSQNEETDESVF